MAKEYGLIIPGKNKMTVQAPGKRAAIFDEDSDSDETSSMKPFFQKPLVKKQTKLAQDKAIEEDPTVYQYDEVYDDMDKQRNESKLFKKGAERKPKYIDNLLKAADRRKRENERRIDRQVQREREAEGDEFKDKESFVTPSYQKKLEEMKLLEEEEKREEYLEAIGDVKKQGNLDGFYRHLYDQKVNSRDKIENEGNKVEEIIVKKHESSEDEPTIDKKMKKNTIKRQYRKREESHSEDETQDIKKQHIRSNLDADSDFSIDSSDSEEEKSSKEVKSDDTIKDKEDNEKEKADSALKEGNIQKSDSNKLEEVIEKTEELVQKKPKIDIYKKRTVGEVFEAARQRYFERCALRESGSKNL